MKSWKKVLSLMLSLIMVLGLIPTEAWAADIEIWVGGVGMLSGDYLAEGASSVTSEKPADNYAYYKDGKLTLHNYSYSGAGYYGLAVYREGNLTIELEGANALTTTEEELAIYVNGDFIIGGSGKLALSSNDYCIGSRALTFQDECIVTANSAIYAFGVLRVKDNAAVIMNGSGDLSASSIDISGGTVTVTAADNYGIYAGKDISISGGTVTVKTTKGDTYSGVGIYSNAGNIEISGGTVTVNADDNGIYAYYNLTISGGTVNVAAGVWGIKAQHKHLTISGGNIDVKSTATGDDDNRYYALFYSTGEGSLTFDKNLTVLASTEPDGTFVEYDKYSNNTYDHVKIGPKSTTYTVTFDPDGGSAVTAQTVESGKTATRPADPIKEGFDFTGWYLNEAEYDFATPVTGNITLKAKWKENTPAKTPITSISVTGVETPSVGMKNWEASDAIVVSSTPADALTAFPEDNFKVCETNSSDWDDWTPMSMGGEFEAGKYYAFVCTVEAAEGYAFSESVSGQVNGNASDSRFGTVFQDESEARVIYVWGPLEAAPTPEIWVGGIGMADGDYLAEGASATTTTKPDDNYAYYNDGVLTLHNYDYSGTPALDIDGSTDYYAVYRDGNLKIVLDGENRLTLTTEDLSSSAGILADDLTVEKGSGNGKLTIRGAGFGMGGDAVTINSGTFDIDVHYAAIMAMLNITIKNGDYDLTTESWGCIYSYDGIVTIENGKFDLVSEYGNGINSSTGSVNVKNGTLEIDASTGIDSVDILIEGGTLTIAAEYGIDVYSEDDQPTSITIKGGTLDVTAEQKGLYAWKGSIDIQSGDMVIRSTDIESDDYNCALWADSIAIADTLSVLASTVPEGSNPEVYDKTKNSTYDWIKTGPVIQTTYTATVENGTGDGDYTSGATVTVTADTIPGKLFREWTTSDGVTFADSKNATTTFTMPDKDVTVTAVYDTIITVIDISGITEPVAGAAPSESFTISTTGVEVGSNTFWQVYDEATNTLKASYADSKIVSNEPFRAGTYVKLQAEVIAKEGYVFTPDTVIRYNGVELPAKDDSNLKQNFRYPVVAEHRERTAASIGWDVKNNEYTVTFDSDSGSAVAPQTVESGKTATKPTDPTREGYTFKGWYLGETAYDFATPVTGDITLKAKWEAVEVPPVQHTVTYAANGGTGTMTSDTVKDGTEYTIRANGFTAPSGKIFKCWKVGTKEYKAGDKITVTGDVTITAVWQDAPDPDTPKTGDSMNLVLWSFLAMISALCIAVAVVFGRKRYLLK